VTYVYHSAAFVSFEPDKYHLLRKTNIEGTANIVNLCVANNIKKLCYVSSIAAIGESSKDKEITEDSEWNNEADNSVYAITKYGAEIEVWRGSQEGLDVVIVNPGVVIGAGIWRYGSGSIFNKVFKGNSYFTKGTIGLVDIEDVVNIMIILVQNNIKNERFILVGEIWTYKKFLQTIASNLNVALPKKEAKLWQLQMIWRLDWLINKLNGRRRRLTKQLARALVTEKIYNNNKITGTINYTFKPVEESITEVSRLFL
ncbi:MAG: SDR family oxidoreductase, partial [Flavobacteriaceae bacterium]